MATLSQTLNPLKRTASGGLEEAPNLKQAMANVGATNAPTAPIGGTLIGANPDATKMLGTQAQLNAATSRAQDQAAPVDSLQTAVRQQQSRTATTTTEQQKMQKSADMQALGGLGDRVTNFIETQKQQIAATAPVVAQANAVGAAPTIADPAAAVAALNALMKDSSNPELQKAANLALGRNLETIIQPGEIAGLYQTAQDAISQVGAGAVDDSLNIATLIADPAFGYDANSLSSLLGLPADQISAMTVKQLTDAVNSTITSQFGASAVTDQMSTSGLAGQAERGLSRSAGRELSSTGIRATEADTARLDAQIANADQVSFGGQTYQIEDLLNDETISGIITDYMNSAPDSPERRRIDKTEPALAAFIKNNDALLQDAAMQLTHGADVFKKIQEQVKSLGTQGGSEVDKRLMTALITGFGKDFQTKNVDPESIPFLANLTGKTDYDKKAVIEAVNTNISDGLVVPEEVAALNKDQLVGLNIGAANSNWSKYIKNSTDIREFPKKSEEGKVYSMISGGYSIPEIKQVVQTAKGRTVLGIGDPVDLGFFDPNDLDGSYRRFNPPTTLAKASEGVNVPSKLTIPPTQPLGGHAAALESKLGGAAADGNISDAEISSAGLDLEELIALEDNVGKPRSNISPGVTGIRRAATVAPSAAAAAGITDAPGAGGIAGGAAWETAKKFTALVAGSDPRRTDRGTFQTAASNWSSSLVGGLLSIPKTPPGTVNNTFVNTRGVLMQTFDELSKAGLLTAAGQAAWNQVKSATGNLAAAPAGRQSDGGNNPNSGPRGDSGGPADASGSSKGGWI